MIKHAFSMFYTLIKQVFDQSERAQGPVYVIIDFNIYFQFSLQYFSCFYSGVISMSSPAVVSVAMNTYWPQDDGTKIFKYGTLPLVSIGTEQDCNIKF